MLNILDRWGKTSRAMISGVEVNHNGDECDMVKCVVCNCESEEENIRHITIKGAPKKICKECVAAIKGFS